MTRPCQSARRVRGLLVLPALLWTAGALAQAPSRPTMALAQGACERLVIGGRDETGACTGRLMNTTYPDGRVGFYFVTRDGAALTFTGMGSSQVKPDTDTAVQPVDAVIVGLAGKPERRPAVGTCRFTNPYKGPGTVRCRAETDRGAFEGAFTTDGAKSSILRP
ncbi:hypothetical protein [Methylobacterium sp. A54F]